MAYLKSKTHGEICVYCKKIRVYGVWSEHDVAYHRFFPLETRNTICPDCSRLRFPKFYVNNRSSNKSRIKEIASKFIEFVKKNQ
jgi:hypothetical protein